MSVHHIHFMELEVDDAMYSVVYMTKNDKPIVEIYRDSILLVTSHVGKIRETTFHTLKKGFVGGGGCAAMLTYGNRILNWGNQVEDVWNLQIYSYALIRGYILCSSH